METHTPQTHTHNTHTHTHSRSKSTPSCSLPNQRSRKSVRISPNRWHARHTLTDAHCLSSTGLQRFPGELRAAREALPEICQPLQDGYWLTGKEFLCHFDGSPVEHGIGSQNAAERHSFSVSKHIMALFTSGCAQNQTIKLGIRYQGDGNTAHTWICQPYAAFRRLLERSTNHDCLLREWSLPISRKPPEGETWRGDEIPHGYILMIFGIQRYKKKVAESKQI